MIVIVPCPTWLDIQKCVDIILVVDFVFRWQKIVGKSLKRHDSSALKQTSYSTKGAMARATPTCYIQVCPPATSVCVLRWTYTENKFYTVEESWTLKQLKWNIV